MHAIALAELAWGNTDTGNVWRSCTATINCWSEDHTMNVPIVEYRYGNGATSGNAYTASPVLGVSPWARVTNGQTRSREVFTIDHATTIDQIGVRINPVAAGTAVFRVARKSDDAVVAVAQIPYSLPPALDNGCKPYTQSCSNNGITLVADLTPTTLQPGTYYMDFDCASGIYGVEALHPYIDGSGGLNPAVQPWGEGTRFSGELQSFNGSSWEDTPHSVGADAFAYLRTR